MKQQQQQQEEEEEEEEELRWYTVWECVLQLLGKSLCGEVHPLLAHMVLVERTTTITPW
jgi:hypothetical protein